MSDLYHPRFCPELDAVALRQLQDEMRAAKPKSNEIAGADGVPRVKKMGRELRHALNTIGRLKKEAMARENQIANLLAENRNLRDGKKMDTKGRAWQEVRRLRKLAYFALCALHGTPYDLEHSTNDLRRLVWTTYVLDMNMGQRVQCCHCGKLLTWEEFTMEHLCPRVLGGTDEIENLRPSCEICNCSRPVEDISHRFSPPPSPSSPAG